MKKRILAILLAALMVVPFTVFSTMGVSAEGAEKVELPAEPQPYRDITVYISYQKTSGVQASDDNIGTSADQLFGTFGKGVFPMIEIPGGVICIPGKGYVGTNYTFPKCGNPVTVTAFDPQLNKRYEGTLEVIAEDGTVSNGSQLGMFMIFSTCTLTIAGDYIFENIDIIERGEGPGQNAGTSKISVANGGKLVIKDDVKIMKMSNAEENVIVNVDAGGYLYLHQVGFEKYTGDGVIVMTKALYDQAKSAKDVFVEFRGAVVDPDGTILQGTMPQLPEEDEDDGKDTDNGAADTNKPSSKPSDKPATTDKNTAAAQTDAATNAADGADEGSFPIAIVIGGVAAAIVVAVVIIIIVKKKKA